MIWTELATQLFGSSHDVRADGDFLSGSADFDGQTLAVVGTTNHAPIGFALALRHAEFGIPVWSRFERPASDLWPFAHLREGPVCTKASSCFPSSWPICL